MSAQTFTIPSYAGDAIHIGANKTVEDLMDILMTIFSNELPGFSSTLVSDTTVNNRRVIMRDVYCTYVYPWDNPLQVEVSKASATTGVPEISFRLRCYAKSSVGQSTTISPFDARGATIYWNSVGSVFKYLSVNNPLGYVSNPMRMMIDKAGNRYIVGRCSLEVGNDLQLWPVTDARPFQSYSHWFPTIRGFTAFSFINNDKYITKDCWLREGSQGNSSSGYSQQRGYREYEFDLYQVVGIDVGFLGLFTDGQYTYQQILQGQTGILARRL